MMQIGLDVGSTTVKAVVLNARKEIVFRRYQRHYSQIIEKTHELLTDISAATGTRIMRRSAAF